MLTTPQRRFYRRVFLAAALYNLLWGTLILLFPRAPFRLANLPIPDDTAILLFQCIAMFVLVYAPGYLYVAHDPDRHYPFALVGLLGKICGPLGWLWAWQTNKLPPITGLTILTNDILWWPFFIPFVLQTTRATGPPPNVD